ncbi:hypothetical protein CCAL9344_07880 [Campylobacter sp. RM9344]|uniref:Uncharacterized protein n=1 Tax=Campylobacter californiensis TaxID=1032243 RepID=A0AAW3ZZ22_9BACT|nr:MULTISPECIES: hypothetical protein [unclassified Campylobacter]MBE2985480.1 hypothetical protein [Campylobacter sp. RM6883]MBE2995901.1 hypothetical protein [Campylobacter sp. RM6913]MBE3030096.1 hypothetical protein [Campylobacter sp. RM9344]MBE3608785.1 hypothetical protein [Campylobacter sp. RM9337]QCD51210.1 hypothetical protein CCAL_1325 [Campylobacter sp. RM6914]
MIQYLLSAAREHNKELSEKEFITNGLYRESLEQIEKELEPFIFDGEACDNLAEGFVKFKELLEQIEKKSGGAFALLAAETLLMTPPFGLVATNDNLFFEMDNFYSDLCYASTEAASGGRNIAEARESLGIPQVKEFRTNLIYAGNPQKGQVFICELVVEIKSTGAVFGLPLIDVRFKTKTLRKMVGETMVDVVDNVEI